MVMIINENSETFFSRINILRRKYSLKMNLKIKIIKLNIHAYTCKDTKIIFNLTALQTTEYLDKNTK